MSSSQDCSTTDLKPAILYGRVSPKPDHCESVDSIDVQEESCRKYAALRGLSIAIVLRDPDISARKVPLFERPEGSRIPHLVSGGLKHIICVRLDRMFRSTVDGLTIMNQWNEQGVALHLADQGGVSINCSTATGEMVATMLLAYASFEPRLTAERTSASMKSKQKRGLRMTSEATIPWGWMSDKNSKINERGNASGIVPCALERHLTRGIRTRMEGGESASFIARQLNAFDDFCRGKPWDHNKVLRAANATWETT